MRREQWNPEEATVFVVITSQEVKARQALQNAHETLHNAEQKASRLQHDQTAFAKFCLDYIVCGSIPVCHDTVDEAFPLPQNLHLSEKYQMDQSFQL